MTNAYEFIYNDDIEIKVPVLHIAYEDLTEQQRAELHHECDKISGMIPEKIREFEGKYKQLYKELREQENDEDFYRGVDQLNQISRNICELNIWYLRMQGRHLTSAIE